MNIPEKIRIAGIKYDIRYEDRLNDGVNLCYGHIDYDKAVIRLAPNIQSHDGKCQTLLHELLHGIAKHFQLEVESDEDTINKLSKGLYMVIADNPNVFDSDKCVNVPTVWTGDYQAVESVTTTSAKPGDDPARVGI